MSLTVKIFLNRGAAVCRVTAFVAAALADARCKLLGGWHLFRGNTVLPGSLGELEKCREVLQEALEEWLVLKLRDCDLLPPVEGN